MASFLAVPPFFGGIFLAEGQLVHVVAEKFMYNRHGADAE